MAHMAATSRAALEETPLPSGTSELMSRERPSSKVCPTSCISTSRAPATYAAQLQRQNQ